MHRSAARAVTRQVDRGKVTGWCRCRSGPHQRDGGVLGSGARPWTFSRPRQSRPELIRPIEGREGRSSAMPRRHHPRCSPPRRPRSPQSPCRPAPPVTVTPAATAAARRRPAARFVFGAAGDPAMLDPAFGTDGETFRVSRQIFEGLLGNELGGTDPVPGAGRGLRGQRGRPRVHLHPPRGREVPRRHGLQRRGGLLQLRPLVQLRGPGPEPERLVLLPGRLRRLRQHAGHPEHLRELRGDRRDHRRHPDHPGHQSKFPAALALPTFSIQSPTALRGVRRRQPRRQRGRARPTPSTPSSTRPAPAPSSSRAGTAATARSPSSATTTTGVSRPSSTRSSSGRSPTGTPAGRSSRPARSTATTSSPRPTTTTLEDDGFQVLVRDPFNILYLGINGGNVPGTARQPGAAGPAGPPGDRPRDRPRDDRELAAARRRRGGHAVHAADGRRLGRRRDDLRVRPGAGEGSCSPRPAPRARRCGSSTRPTSAGRTCRTRPRCSRSSART